MRIVFMGTPAAAARSLERVIADGHEVVGVYTQPDRPSGRGNKIVFSPVKELALREKLPLFQPSKIRTSDAITDFRSLQADIAVVVAYGRILPEDLLNAYPYGAVNVHFSLLPKYRGAAPVNWAIVNGERSTGVTTIQMDTGLDTGDILLARETYIGYAETAPQLMDRLSEIGAELLAETLRNLDTIRPVPQDDSAASFAPIMKREDGLIDWNRPASEISDRIRGFQPFPGSFTYYSGSKVTIWAAKAVDAAEMATGPPGSLAVSDDGRVLVATGDGMALEIYELQLEGKKRISVRDALNGSLLTSGQHFSDETRPKAHGV